MANEARVFAEGTENVIVRQFTVADGTAIAKGTMLIANGATRTGVAHGTVIRGRPLGYTTSSKEANDGFTELGCQRTGVVVAISDGVISTGDIVVLGDTANTVRSISGAAADFPVNFSRYEDLNNIVGRALDTVADATGVRVALSLG